jgi:periplasmic divalent cation tolerance protein
MGVVIAFTTVPVGERGEAIARALVDERLAACVNALPPMTSIYRWQGDVAVEAERQLIIKTLRRQVPALEKRLHELHPYDVPEFLVLDVMGGAERYLAWLEESV